MVRYNKETHYVERKISKGLTESKWRKAKWLNVFRISATDTGANVKLGALSIPKDFDGKVVKMKIEFVDRPVYVEKSENNL